VVVPVLTHLFPAAHFESSHELDFEQASGATARKTSSATADKTA
jgi:hypothetical protein